MCRPCATLVARRFICTEFQTWGRCSHDYLAQAAPSCSVDSEQKKKNKHASARHGHGAGGVRCLHVTVKINSNSTHTAKQRPNATTSGSVLCYTSEHLRHGQSDSFRYIRLSIVANPTREHLLLVGGGYWTGRWVSYSEINIVIASMSIFFICYVKCAIWLERNYFCMRLWPKLGQKGPT